jgi:hypothetical protein
VHCLIELQFTAATVELVQQLLVEYMESTADSPALMKAAVRVFHQLCHTFTQPVTEEIRKTMWPMLNDSKLPIETRITVAEYVCVNHPMETHFTLLSALDHELQREAPNFYFVERLVRIALLVTEGQFWNDTKEQGIKTSGRKDMFGSLHRVILAVPDIHFSLLASVLQLFRQLFGVDWSFHRIADGIIEGKPVQFTAKAASYCMCSDSD